MKKILIVVGTRPNFIKVTQFPRVFKEYKETFDYKIVHTGQHSDDKMANVFFRQFGFEPDIFLNIGQGAPNTQMARIMLSLEETISGYKPDLVMVVGDVNSTLAAALTANKMNIKVAHLESGLRSFDRTMPEEINRILTDEITDYFFVTEQSGIDNLLKEGKKKENIFFVGNTMIDTLVAFQEKINEVGVLEEFNLRENEYVLLTMHRPATVDNKEGLEKLLEIIKYIAGKYAVVFPIHPRTLNNINSMGLEKELEECKNLVLTEPLDYLAFQKLVASCKFILTDSGGIQEESTFCKISCLTLRPNTERPSTVTIGTNELIPFDMNIIKSKVAEIEEGTFKKGGIPPLWDGKSTERIVEILSRAI